MTQPRLDPTRAREDPSLVHLWGPRFSAYVVAEPDIAVYSLGRLPDDAAGRVRRAHQRARRGTPRAPRAQFDTQERRST